MNGMITKLAPKIKQDFHFRIQEGVQDVPVHKKDQMDGQKFIPSTQL